MAPADIRTTRSPGARRRAALCALASALALWQIPAFSAEPALPAGLNAPAKPTALPSFDLPVTAGGTLRSESLRGQVAVIRFWASW
jgi:hypothetical protein